MYMYVSLSEYLFRSFLPNRQMVNRQSKTVVESTTNIDEWTYETAFSIALQKDADNLQSKTIFQGLVDSHDSL